MTKQELIQKLSTLEWEDFEVKTAKSELPKSVWETVSAFSNTSGGWLVLGVSQKGPNFEITGVGNAEKLEQDFLNTLRGTKFNVFVETQQEKYEIAHKTVLAFYIPVHKHKPVYFNNQSNTFIRRGSADQRATQAETDSMLRDRAFGTKTAELAPETNRESLSNTSLSRYRDYMARFNANASYNRYDEFEFLEKLRIMDKGMCTFAGLLMFGKRVAIEKHFADFRIDLIEVPGTSYAEAKQRYTFRLDEYDNLWEYYFECFARLKQKVDVRFSLTAEGFGEELSPGLESIREALVNLLMHTDYFSPASPRIRIFTNHIEFYNPGGLPKPYEELRAKDISLPRNPILTKLFRMVKLAENVGFGFDKMDANWKSYCNKLPDYQIELDSVIINFPLVTPSDSGSGSEGISKEPEINDFSADDYGRLRTITDDYGRLTDNEKKILRYLLDNAAITRKIAVEILNLQKTKAHEIISALVGKSLIVKRGQGRSTHYILNSKKDKNA